MTGALAAAGSGAPIEYPFASETITGFAPSYYTMASSGAYSSASGGGYWVRYAAPSNYEVYCTVTSGALSSGSTGSWLPFTGSDYTWQKDSGAPVTIQLELRDKYSLTVVKTVSITLEP